MPVASWRDKRDRPLRNRFTKVERFAVDETSLWHVDYRYDHLNRLIGRSFTNSAGTQSESYIYDGSQIALRLDGDFNVVNRYLWGPQVDQLLADEQVTRDSSGNVTDRAILWALGDHQNSVRDLADFDPMMQTTSVVNHKAYDAFGALISETNSAVDTLFAWTGRYFDDATDLYNNLHRWHGAGENQFLNEDPLGLGPDINPRRYTGNDPVNKIDPDGLEDTRPPMRGDTWPSNGGATLTAIKRLMPGQYDDYLPPGSGDWALVSSLEDHQCVTGRRTMTRVWCPVSSEAADVVFRYVQAERAERERYERMLAEREARERAKDQIYSDRNPRGTVMDPENWTSL
jgi:RHS repeat-associated protein